MKLTEEAKIWKNTLERYMEDPSFKAYFNETIKETTRSI